MRKGQVKIIEKAKRNGYANILIDQLSRNDLTIKEINQLYNDYWIHRDKEDDWLKAYSKITDLQIRHLISLCYDYNINLNESDLKQMTSIKEVCKFFSRDGVICKDINDVRIIIYRGCIYDIFTNSFLDFGRKVYAELSEKKEFQNLVHLQIEKIVVYLSKYANSIIEFDKFIKEINIKNIQLNKLADYIKSWQKSYFDFELFDASGVPLTIKNIDFQGYSGILDANGLSRKISYGQLCYYIQYVPFTKIHISESGNFYPKTINEKKKTIMFFYKEMSFMTQYQTKKGPKNKPTQLKELFEAISIADTDEDKTNALLFIEFLCKIYNTYIFRDLYYDYLASGGLLLPCLVKDVIKYYNKRDLMLEVYHCYDLNVDLNKRNVNIIYALSKVYKRMTDKAFGRAIQVKNIKVCHVGRERWKFAYILYTGLYNIDNDYNAWLLNDAIREEYEYKKLSFSSPKIIINRHNRRQFDHKPLKAKKLTFKISSKTKFKTLIDNMPKEYELIKTPHRLITETIMQHNCVATSNWYAKKINNDKSMLYSAIFDNKRHTIEIGISNEKYIVVQCFRACNQPPNKEFEKELKSIVQKINLNKEKN